MIIRNYIVREIILTSAETLFVLMLIIVGNTFICLLGKVSDGGLYFVALGKLVIFTSINKLIKEAPITCL